MCRIPEDLCCNLRNFPKILILPSGKEFLKGIGILYIHFMTVVIRDGETSDMVSPVGKGESDRVGRQVI